MNLFQLQEKKKTSLPAEGPLGTEKKIMCALHCVTAGVGRLAAKRGAYGRRSEGSC